MPITVPTRSRAVCAFERREMSHLIVPDLANFFYSRLMRGAEDYLAEAGYRLLVADSRDDWKRQRDFLLSFSGNVADAIILVPCMATSAKIAKIPAHRAQDTARVRGPKPPPMQCRFRAC